MISDTFFFFFVSFDFNIFSFLLIVILTRNNVKLFCFLTKTLHQVNNYYFHKKF